ncbi:major capsid protein [Sporosarcina sp. ITBMC105]
MAGITHLEEFKPEALGALAREVDKEAYEVQDDILGFLPDENHYDLEFAYNVVKTTSQMGAMIGFGAEPPIRDRDEVARRMGEVAKFGWKDIITENELLKLHNPRNDGEFKALIDAITVNGAKMVKETRDRMNLAKLQAIGTGKVTYDDNNVKITIDFTDDMPAEHKVALTGVNTWANADHDIIGDLIAWNEQYEETNGKKADAIYLTRKVQALLLKNAVIVNEVAGSTTSGRTRVNADELNSVLGAYGLPPVRLVKKTTAKVKSPITGQLNTVTLYPENRVLFVSNGIGTFKLGPTVENNFQPGIVLQAYDKNEPIQSILRTAAAGFPVIENPSLLLYADVLEG